MKYNFVNKIENEKQFMNAWEENEIDRVAEINEKGNPIKHRNWKKLDRIKEELCHLWHQKFRDTIDATVCNNFNPKNYLQFMDFEIKKKI